MIFLFKNNDKLYLITLPVFICITFFSGLYFFNFHSSDNCPAIGLSWLNFSSKFQYLLEFICVLTGSFFLNIIATKHELIEKQNHLPGVIFALLSSLFLHSPVFFPFFVANLLVMGSLHNFMGSYREESSGSKIFDGSFMLGSAIILYPSYVLVLLLPFFALLIFKPFSLREWVFAVLGLFTPYLFVFFYYFMNNQSVFTPFEHINGFIQTFHRPYFHTNSILFLTSLLFVCVLTILNFFISPIVKKIKSQKSKSLLGWLWFFCAFDLFLSSKQSLIPFPVAIVPISVFLGDFLSNMKRTFWSGFLFLLLVGSFFYLALLIKS